MITRASLFGLVSLLILTAGCGQKTSSAKLEAAPSGLDLPLTSIGRGAKLTLTKDLEVPANSDSIILDAVTGTYEAPNDEGNLYHKSYVRCGIQMREASVDRRVLPAGTVIVFSGEAGSHPHEENPSFKYDDIMISSPAAAQQVSCIKIAAQCWEGMCDPFQQRKLLIRDFKDYMSGTATLDLAPPVIVHNE